MFGLFRKKENPAPGPQTVEEWIAAGRPVPPPHAVKQQNIKTLREQFGCRVLVETGTYLGDMVEAMLPFFDTVYSIELSEKLHRRALKRFSGNDRVKLLQGDSGKKISEVLTQLNEPALFWLDGHYSGGITALGDKECPVPEELAAIFTSPFDHVILIDDARLFTGENSYPTLDAIQDQVAAAHRSYTIKVEDDIIRLLPKTAAS